MKAPATSYGQYCPITRAVEVLGERWTLLIVRDLLLGTTRFNDLARGLPGLSRSLLTKRLRGLVRAGIVQRAGVEYVLTHAGRELEPIVFGLGSWGAAWAFGEPGDHELDAQLLVWWMHTRLDTAELPGHVPGRRAVVHVRFSDDRRQFWIVVDGAGPSVCDVDPGYDVDVVIRSDVRTLFTVWNGAVPLADALRTGRLSFDATPEVRRAMPRVLRLSPIAPTVAAACAAERA